MVEKLDKPVFIASVYDGRVVVESMKEKGLPVVGGTGEETGVAEIQVNNASGDETPGVANIEIE